MAFDPVIFARAVHVIAAALWVGGAFFMAFIFGPHIRAAGPAAGPVMATALRRGGFSPFFGTSAVVAVLAGGYVYGDLRFFERAFDDLGGIVFTVGVAAGILGMLVGVALVAPNESRMKKLVAAMPTAGPPSPEQGQQMMALAAKQGKLSAIAASLAFVALLGMTLGKVF